MTDDLILYHVPDWASSIILAAFEETGAPYRLHPMDFDAGDFSTPEFRAINPHGQIPAILTPAGPMFETAAIILWLNDRYGGLGPRTDEPGREAFLSWLLYVSNTIHPTVMDMIHPERPGGDEAAPFVARAAQERLNLQAGRLETLITTQRPDWLSTARTGALGHYLGVILRWTDYLVPDPALRFSLAPYPALTAVLAAHEASPAGQALGKADGMGPRPYTDPTPA